MTAAQLALTRYNSTDHPWACPNCGHTRHSPHNTTAVRLNTQCPTCRRVVEYNCIDTTCTRKPYR